MENRNRKKDLEEFGLFFEKHQGLLYSFAKDYFEQIEDCEDCIQSVLAEIIKRLDMFLTFSEPRRVAYCKKAIQNEAIDQIKRKAKQSSEELNDNIPGDLDIADDYIVKERNAVLQQCLRSLRPEYRKVIEMFYFYGLSASEISQKMELSVGTVWTYLSRARAELKHRFEEQYFIE